MARPKSYNLKTLRAMRAIVCVVASAMVSSWGPHRPSARRRRRWTRGRCSTQYCFTCHNDRLKTGGLSLERDGPRRPSANPPDVWEKVVRRLRTGAMPPPPARRPDQATYDRLTGWLERRTGPPCGRPSESRPARCSSPEPIRIRQRDSRPAGSRRRTSRRCCRRTTRRSASTTSPTCSASRRCCSSGI